MERRKRARHRKDPRGFTLVEVLLSVAILGTTIMTVFTIYAQSIVEIRRARNRTIATHAAQTMMEMIVSSPHAISNYHGLTTITAPPIENPVRDDLLDWQSMLHAFPTSASGAISVGEDLSGQIVTVTISYEDYSRTTTTTLALKPEKRPQLLLLP
jgi:prepilin-type N-terminal cleavage/methylation domain-containing protein